MSAVYRSHDQPCYQLETHNGHTGKVSRQTEFVLRSMEERNIRFVRLWFTDVLGSLKSVAIAPAEVEGAFVEGVGFDGSAIEGLSLIHISEPTNLSTSRMPSSA